MSLVFGNKESMLSELEANLKSGGIKYVDRQKQEIFGDYQYPLAFINDSSESRTYILTDCIKVEWTIAVVAYALAGTTPSTSVNSLISIVKSGIEADITLGGNAYNTRIIRIDTDEGFAYPNCMALVTVVISYLSED